MNNPLKNFRARFHSPWAELLILLPLLVGNAVFLKFNAFRCFNFFDMSIYIDGGWRILHGQKPYTDFIYFNTPLHLYLTALFFKIFGFGLTALLAQVIVVHSLVIVFTLIIARRYLALGPSLLVTLLTTTCFYWPISFPWHDQTAHFWGIMGLTILTTRNWEKKAGPSLTVMFTCGILVILALMTKINIGIAYGVLFLGVSLIFDQKLVRLGSYGIGLILGIALSKIFIPDLKDFWEQLLSYNQLHFDRVRSFTDITNWFTNYFWLPFLIVCLNSFNSWSTMKRWLIFYLGLTFVCIFSMVTGGMIHSANIFLWGIYLCYSLILLEEIKRQQLGPWQKKLHLISQRIMLIFTIFLVGLSAYYGQQLKVWSYTGKNYLGNYPLKSSPLTGWLFSRNRGEALDEIVDYIRHTVPREESLLVLSDMTIIYALTDRESFRHIPIATFEPQRTPPPGPLLEKVKFTLHHNPPDWIFTEIPSFITMAPYLDMVEEFHMSYRLVKSWGPYAIFRYYPHVRSQ